VATLLEQLDYMAGEGELRVDNVDPPVRTPRTSALARRFARAIRHQDGVPRFKLKTGTSDLNVLTPAWGCPALAYGPGDSRLDHTPEEHLSIGELERAVDVLDVALRAA